MLSVRKEDFLEDLIDEVADTTQRKRGKYPNTFQNQFTNRRINAKYIELANRYAQFTDDDEIFGQMVAIILELVKDKEYIKISKTGRNDEISWIITTAEQRMWDYIQKNYTMNFVSRVNGEYAVENNFVSYDDDGELECSRIVPLDDFTYLGGGDFISNHEIYQIGDDDPTEYEYMLGLQHLDELMNSCRLTTSQKNIVLALENTRDVEGGIYNITDAASQLGKTRQAVSESWNNIKNKMENALNEKYSLTEVDKTIMFIEDMFDNAETDKDVLMWTKDALRNPSISDIFYELDGKDRRQIIRAMNTEPCNSHYYKKSIRKFLSDLHAFVRKH